MLAYALRRLLGAIPTIFIIITASFFMMRAAPGGPFDQERTLEATVMENLNRIYQLDRPLIGTILALPRRGRARRFRPLLHLPRFHRGRTAHSGPAGLDDAGGIGAAAGDDARRAAGVPCRPAPEQRIDYAVIAVATFGITVPNFVVAPVLSLVFAV